MNKREAKTVNKMIHMYCAAKHGTSRSLCTACDELNEYAQKRLSYCKFGNNKPTCEKCPVHCYTPQMRARIKEVMKYAGPRMILHHPFLAFSHLFKGILPRNKKY